LHESGDSIDNAKADEAEGYATRALSLAEKIYPANDTKLFKPLRMLGLIKDKQGKFDKAVELLDRAYTVASQVNLNPTTI
jgi:tetratricopeptide (TPR) repeat protein